jgi:hypothetical protein
LLLVRLHVVEGLQHGLHQLSLGGEKLLQVSVVVVVVAARLAVALAVPGVHHLMVWERGKNEIPRNQTSIACFMVAIGKPCFATKLDDMNE